MEWSPNSLRYSTSRNPLPEELTGLKDLVKLASNDVIALPSLPRSREELEAALWCRLGEAYQGRQEDEALNWYDKAIHQLSKEAGMSKQEVKVLLDIDLEERKHEESVILMTKSQQIPISIIAPAKVSLSDQPLHHQRLSRRIILAGSVGGLIAVSGLTWPIYSAVQSIFVYLRSTLTQPHSYSGTDPVISIERSMLASGGTDPVISIGWSPDGKMLASGDVAGRINIWSVKPSSNTPITSYLYLPFSSVNSITWSPDGQSIAAGYNDFTIHIWRGTSRKPLLSYSDHKDPIHNLAWSSQQNLIASVSSGSFAYDVHIWDATTGGRVINKLPLTPELKVSSLVWSHKSSPLSLAISVHDPTGSVYIWKQNENPPFGEPFQLNPPITAVAWKEDDTQLLIATDPSMFQVYENSVFTLSPGATSTNDVPFQAKYPDSNGVKAICWNAGLIYAACSNGTLHIEDGNPGHAIQYQTSTDGVTQNQSAWAWSPNGKYFAHGMIDGSVVVWQVPQS